MDKAMEALKPCPLCGASFRIAQEPHDNHPVAGMFYIFHDYGPLGSAARRCVIDVSMHFATEAEALAAWNTRATPEPVAPPSPDIAGLVDRLVKWGRCLDPDRDGFAAADIGEAAIALQLVAQERDAANATLAQVLEDVRLLRSEIAASFASLKPQLAAAEARIATARDEGLEMAAKVADGFFEGPGISITIRALKGTKP